MPKSHCLLPAMLLCAAGSALAAAPRYSVTVLDSRPNASAVSAINNAGVALGSLREPDREGRSAFTWSAGGRTMLPAPMRTPTGISEMGHVVGSTEIALIDDGRITINAGLLYFQGAATTLPAPFSPQYDVSGWFSYVSPAGVNSAGTVVANQQTNGASGAYMDSHGTTTILPLNHVSAINEAGQVAGTGRIDGGPRHAMLYANGQAVDLGALPSDLEGNSAATDVNDAGTVVGLSDHGFGNQALSFHSFIYQDGVLRALGSLGMSNAAKAINNHGDVVGENWADGSEQGKHAYLYQDGVQYDLDTLLSGGGNWRITEVEDINDSGQIVGRACRDGIGCYAALLSPVPEPASCGMLLAGLGLLGWRARRQGRNALPAQAAPA
ncbi:PEP-CTERM sorting domain-containing protein [Pseudoduganella sp. UC29_71]|uniref:PEP-CTERM sorting domain-containing protein n=1 Tax=Pseudoduganella sp. UC29_71 TaxID=3350174 RepID=UPI003671F176